MYPIMVLLLAIWLSMLMEGVAGQNHDLATLYQTRTKYMQVVSMAENIEQFYLEKATFPPSIPALAATTGFEHSRALADNWQGYAVSPTITDSVWQFNRAVLFSNDPSKGVNVASYLASNACGAGGYDTATSWCGAATGRWFRRETRERYNEQISTQRARMSRLLQKFTDYYNTNGKFPDKDSGGTALGLNSISNIAALAAFGGSAGSCSGTYTYLGVPIDCGDMYDVWGRVIGYQFVSSKHVLVISETPIFNNSGNRVVVAADFDNSLL